MNAETLGTNKERAVTVFSGWIALPVAILLLVGGLTVFIFSVAAGANELSHPIWGLFVVGLIGVFVGIVIWRIQDTAQATFDVDDYEKYVETQSESALRHLASCYAYDHGEENETTLRSGVEEVSQALRSELQERLAKAGVVVEEARLMHLAYAPEIAQAMLRRQQAEAVIDEQ